MYTANIIRYIYVCYYEPIVTANPVDISTL